MATLRAVLENPYLWFAAASAAAVGVWWWKMTATTANLTLIFAVLALAVAVSLLPQVVKEPVAARALWFVAVIGAGGLIAYYSPLWTPKTMESRDQHPVISVSSATATRNPSTGQIEINTRLHNASAFDVTIDVSTTVTWSGVPTQPGFPNRRLGLAAQARMNLISPVTLDPVARTAFANGTSELRVEITATYPDQGQTTRFIFGGKIEPDHQDITVLRNEWIRQTQ